MKKLTLTGLVAAGVLLTTACSEDNTFQPQPGEGGNVTFTIQLPAEGLGSRAFADGTTANNLVYAIYDAETDALIAEDATTFAAGELKKTVNISLANGKSYKIAFFAHNATTGVYNFDAENTSLSVDYAKMAEYNTTDHDAFYKLHETGLITGAVNQSVELTRPLAQINWGTSDLDEPAVTAAYGQNAANLKTQVTFKGVYTSFNLLTGERDETSTTDVTFEMSARPSGQTYPVTGYEYLSMNYILAKDGSSTSDAELTVNNADAAPVVVSNMPYQANYRTNIYGALLAVPGVFNVEKVPGFADPAYDQNLANKIAEGVFYNEATKTYTLTSVDGLTWLNNQTNKESNQFAGYTVELGANIDMSGVKWTPLNKNSFFDGTFDGKGYSISNMTTSDADCAGFIWSNRGVVQNLKMINPSVKGNFKAGAIAGDGLCGSFDNCTVEGGVIESTPRKNGSGMMDDGNNVGAIVGYLSAEPNASLTNCTVSGVTLKAYRTVAPVAGTVGGGNAVVTGNKAIDCTVVANQLVDNYDGAPRDPQAGELFGRVINGASAGDSNKAENVSVSVLKAENNEIAVATATDLKALGAIAHSHNFVGKTIKLSSDIDADGADWGTGLWNSGTFKNAIIDGDGHTISNLEMKGGFAPAGVQTGLVVKNLTFKDCHVSQGVAGAGMVASQLYYGFTIENVHVIGGSVTAKYGVGGLVGQWTNEYDGIHNATIKDCTVNGVTLTATAEGLDENSHNEGGANAFIGSNSIWFIGDTNLEEVNNIVTIENSTYSDCTFVNNGKLQGGGNYSETLYNTTKGTAATITAQQTTVK